MISVDTDFTIFKIIFEEDGWYYLFIYQQAPLLVSLDSLSMITFLLLLLLLLQA